MQVLKPAIFLCWLLIISCAPRPAATGGKLNWMTLQEVENGLQKEVRPVLIDLYTDWCGWCKVMDKKTYADKNVSSYLQQKFYTVKVDAESRSAISWQGKTYAYNTGYRTNDFAVYLTKGELAYPTTVIIPPDGEPQAIPGFLSPNEMELIVKYFGEGNFGKVSFETFQKSFKSGW